VKRHEDSIGRPGACHLLPGLKRLGANGAIFGSGHPVTVGWQYPYGKLGVIEKSAMAGMLTYRKNPLEHIALVEDYENNLKLIMKDSRVYKNTLR